MIASVSSERDRRRACGRRLGLRFAAREQGTSGGTPAQHRAGRSVYVELLDELRRRGPAPRGILFQGTFEREQQSLGRVRTQQRQRREILMLLLVDDAEQALAFPRAL